MDFESTRRGDAVVRQKGFEARFIQQIRETRWWLAIHAFVLSIFFYPIGAVSYVFVPLYGYDWWDWVPGIYFLFCWIQLLDYGLRGYPEGEEAAGWQTDFGHLLRFVLVMVATLTMLVFIGASLFVITITAAAVGWPDDAWWYFLLGFLVLRGMSAKDIRRQKQNAEIEKAMEKTR